jgi:hypothetical protein
MSWWLVIKVLVNLAPLVHRLVKEGRIREAGQMDVVQALKERMDARVDSAVDARARPHDDGVPDPNDRSNFS